MESEGGHGPGPLHADRMVLVSSLATITFLGEQLDLIEPDAAVPVAGRLTERQWPVRHQPVDDPSGHAPGRLLPPVQRQSPPLSDSTPEVEPRARRSAKRVRSSWVITVSRWWWASLRATGVLV
jgi:hypothetical protein